MLDKTKEKIKEQLKRLHADEYVERIKQKMVLPEQFMDTCTLREGTFIVVTILQVVAVMFSGFLISCILIYPSETTLWWEKKFIADFDPYWNHEYETELINPLKKSGNHWCFLWIVWKPVSLALIAVHGIYILTGWIVYYALWDKDVHPWFYLPWLIWTAFLVSANYLSVLGLIVGGVYICTFRGLNVTWDIVPTILVFIYALGWSYAFVIVLAHYKRRVIVRWWKDYEQKKMRL